MRISSSVLFCILSVSLVAGVTILEVPTTSDVQPTDETSYAGNENLLLQPIEPVVETDEELSGRRLLRVLPRVIHRIFVPPKPAPRPAPAPAPKPIARPAPVPAPKPVIVIRHAPKPVAKPVIVIRHAPKPIAKPIAKPAAKPAPIIPVKITAKASPVVVAPVLVVKPVPTPAPAISVPIFFTCDNEFDMYVNGNKVGRGTSWTTTYNFSPIVKSGDVIAIDGVDKGGPAAFIGVFGGKPTKPSDWRCSTKESTGWTLNHFDDSSWSRPVSYGRNSDNNIWRSVGGGSRPNIPADAEWLWTSDNNNHNRVFCRYFMTPAPVAAPVAVAAPKAVPAPVAAPKAAPAPVAVVVATKQSVIDEIISANSKANIKLTKFQEKLLSLMKETSDEQVKVETENRNNFNGVSVTLQNEQVRLETARATMKKLYDETDKLNITIQKHYKKLIADTNYLQSLDTMRPAFLKSLGELAAHIQSVKTVVDNKIVKDEYKDEMVRLLTGIHFNTHNISGYVATAFINHYNKYKNLIQKENIEYSSEFRRLNLLANDYKIQVQKTADIERERVRLQDILSKMRVSLNLSVTQREEFDMLMKAVVSIFDRKRC